MFGGDVNMYKATCINIEKYFLKNRKITRVDRGPCRLSTGGGGAFTGGVGRCKNITAFAPNVR